MTDQEQKIHGVVLSANETVSINRKGLLAPVHGMYSCLNRKL